MKRKITDKLKKWQSEGCKKPFMLIGARQVGKTYIIQDFSKENFKEYLYINLEKEKSIKEIFDNSIESEVIIKQLGLLMGKAVNIDETVIIIDEIQVSERAITSLKYFAESEKNYKIIVAGSLLGIALNRFNSSFPVGKITREYLYPMDFEEFLMALDEKILIDEIHSCYHDNREMFKPVHDKLINYYKDYLFVGGMPESVKSYVEAKANLNYYNREIKRNILEDYLADMNKYTTNAEAIKIKQIFQSIPKQLGRDKNKFSYKLVDEKAKKASYGTAIEWLIAYNLVYKATMIETPRIPMSAYHKENMFKIYMGDTGLLVEMADMTAYDLHAQSANLYRGMITENFIAQTLASKGNKLYYWRSANSAEIDFLINIKGNIIPIEVKASTNTKSKALKIYRDTYKPEYAIKISAKNFGFSGGIKSVPLYATHLIT